MRHESKLQHLVVFSKPYMRSLIPRDYLENLIIGCSLPIKSIGSFEDVFLPVTEGEYTVAYDGKTCVAAMRVSVVIEGEYSLEEILAAFSAKPEYVRAFVEYYFE